MLLEYICLWWLRIRRLFDVFKNDRKFPSGSRTSSCCSRAGGLIRDLSLCHREQLKAMFPLSISETFHHSMNNVIMHRRFSSLRLGLFPLSQLNLGNKRMLLLVTKNYWSLKEFRDLENSAFPSILYLFDQLSRVTA